MLSRFEIFLGWPYPWWWIAAGAVIVFGAGYFWWRLTTRDISSRRAGTLGGLRTGAFLLLVMFVLEPYLRVYEEAEQRPRTGLWLDVSRSMRYPSGRGGRSRYRQALKALEELSSLLEEKGLDVEIRTFSARPMQGKPPGREEDLAAGPTDLASAIEASSPFRASVIFTDGCHNASSNAVKEGENAAAEGTELFAVRAGRELLNLAVRDVNVRRRVGLATVLAIETEVDVALGGEKPSAAGRTQLVLSDEDGRTLEAVTVALEPGSRTYQMEVPVERPGLRHFELSLTPVNGEVTTSDNSAPFAVTVSRHPLKVLYMEGSEYRRPDRTLWEHQYLEQALEEDPDIEVTVLLRDEIPEARALGVWWVKHPEHGYPSNRRELFQYDVIISSDIDIDYFTEDQLKWTVEFVAEHGGGFAMVGGWTAFGPGGYDNSVMDKMLPVDMLGRFEHYVENEEFQWQLTSEGWNHPIMRMDTDAERNRMIWDMMPPFFGHNRVERKKPAAVVLAAHPTDRNLYGPAVILAVQEFGLGRSMAFTTDTTAGWGERFEDEWGEAGDNRYFKRFWRNAVKWLAAYRLTSTERHILLSTDRAFYSSGRRVTVNAAVRDEDFVLGGEVGGVSVTARAPSGGMIQVPMKRMPSGTWQGQFPLREAGEYVLTGRVTLQEGKEEDRLVVMVGKEDIETVDVVADAGFLERVAGRDNVFGPGDMAGLADRISTLPEMTLRFMDVEVFHNWIVLVMAMGLLFVEWFLRKHWGLP